MGQFLACGSGKGAIRAVYWQLCPEVASLTDAARSGHGTDIVGLRMKVGEERYEQYIYSSVLRWPLYGYTNVVG